MSNSGRARLGRGRGRSGSLHSGGASSHANPATSAARLPVVRPNSGGSYQFHPQPNIDPADDSPNAQHFEDGFSSQENQSNQFTLENLLADPNRAITLPKLDPLPTEGTIW